MPQLNLWYQQTHPEPAERAYAFAAAGILTAANWDGIEPFTDRLDAIIQAAGTGPIAWKLPVASALRPARQIGERELAGAWRHGFQHHSAAEHGAARLIVDMPSLLQAGRRSLSTAVTTVSHLLAAPTIARRSPSRGSLLTLEAGDVASVAFAGFPQAYGHQWSWPLRVGLQPSRAWEPRTDVNAIARGFLDVEIGTPGRQDVFVVTEPHPRAISALTESPLGVALVRMSLTAPTPSRNRLLRHWVTDDYLAPAVFFDVPPEHTGEFLNTFTYEMAHNQPLDVAAFGAYARAREHGLDITPPILFAPVDEPGGIFEESRIVTRVNEMTGRLRRLPENAVIEAPMGHAQALGITMRGRSTTRHIHDDLSDAFSADRLDFSQEERGATAMSELEAAVSHLERVVGTDSTSIFKSVHPAPDAAKKPATTQAEGPEANRFTDVALYAGKLFDGDDLSKEVRIADDAPLIGGNDYTFEVAIRLRRTGIAAEQAPDRPVFNPRTDREDLTVYVEVKCGCDGIAFENGLKDAFKALTWPYNADSDSALFRMTTTALAPDSKKEGTLEVHLYHRSLDLLDTVRVPVTLVSADLAAATLPARKLAWPGQTAGMPQVEVNSPERLASITVSTIPGGYRFDFKFRDRHKKEIVIPAVRNISDRDLDVLLERVRDFWTDLIIGSYSENLSVTRFTFKKNLTELVDIGQSAALLLFGDRYAAQQGPSQTIGRLLADMPHAGGELLQIFYSDDAPNFVFPWNLIYYPRAVGDEPDPNDFWGMRYQIEQVRDGPKNDALTDEPITIAFALDPKFGDSQAQKDLLAGYQASSHGKVIVSEPIEQAKNLFAALGAQPSSHLYYFFCHGWAPHGGGALPADSQKRIKELIAGLEDKAKKPWETLLSLLPQMGNQPWLFIGSSKVLESTLQQQKFFNPVRRPIVFINACQSAGLLPSMNSGLARVFLERNACAVIGTESPMTPVFAHAFAKAVLDRLLDGKDVGTALRLSRGHFMSDAVRNPLGLAYTLYGRSTTRLGTGPIIPLASPTPTGGNPSE